MRDVWSHKWMDKRKTAVMFSNRFVSSNVIYTIDDLKIEAEQKDKPYRLVPYHVVLEAMKEYNSRQLKRSFSMALSAA